MAKFRRQSAFQSPLNRLARQARHRIDPDQIDPDRGYCIDLPPITAPLGLKIGEDSLADIYAAVAARSTRIFINGALLQAILKGE